MDECCCQPPVGPCTISVYGRQSYMERSGFVRPDTWNDQVRSCILYGKSTTELYDAGTGTLIWRWVRQFQHPGNLLVDVSIEEPVGVPVGTIPTTLPIAQCQFERLTDEGYFEFGVMLDNGFGGVTRGFLWRFSTEDPLTDAHFNGHFSALLPTIADLEFLCDQEISEWYTYAADGSIDHGPGDNPAFPGHPIPTGPGLPPPPFIRTIGYDVRWLDCGFQYCGGPRIHTTKRLAFSSCSKITGPLVAAACRGTCFVEPQNITGTFCRCSDGFFTCFTEAEPSQAVGSGIIFSQGRGGEGDSTGGELDWVYCGACP